MSRIDDIKAAWMARYGATEEDWDNFKPQCPYTTNVNELKHRQSDHEFDSFDEVASKMEFIFCPDEREMGWRYRAKAQHFLHLAEKTSHDNPVQAADYRTEARFWNQMSESCFKQSDDNRRKL